jgi:hypothetical protein
MAEGTWVGLDGAILQMIVLPPGSGAVIATPPEDWAQIIVVTAAAVIAATAVGRFALAQRRHPS